VQPLALLQRPYQQVRNSCQISTILLIDHLGYAFRWNAFCWNRGCGMARKRQP
jgi:hypothetical protein